MIFKRAKEEDLEAVLSIRYEMLYELNKKELNHDLTNNTEKYFQNGDQATFLAWEEGRPVACATVCYFMVLPTFSHPGGLRAHIMNVYTKEAYRRRGIGVELVKMMIEDAKQRGVSHISLDATQEGRLLYQKCGFTATEEGMELILVR